MRNLNGSNELHTGLSFLLFLQQFSLARNITAITFGRYIFAQCGDGCTRDDFATNGPLDRYLKLLARNGFGELFAVMKRAVARFVDMGEESQGIDALFVDENVYLGNFVAAIVEECVVVGARERTPTTSTGLDLLTSDTTSL